MTATTAPDQSVPAQSPPGFGAVLKSEWTKLRTVRSTWIIAFLAIVLSIGFSALMAFVTGVTWDDWGEVERAAFDPLIYSVNGVLFSLILLIVLGATAATSEYGSGMIRTTFIVNARRTRVFAAKAILVGVLGILISAISVLGMFFASQAIFGSYGLETSSITDSDATRYVVVYILVAGLIYTLIPFSVGFLLRGTASAVTASIGFYFLPFMVSMFLPAWAQENIFRYFPDIAMDSVAGLTESDSALYLSQGSAIAVIAAWLLGALLLAGVMLNRRDA